MKKILIILGIFLITLTTFGQLNENSIIIKEKTPDTYNAIKNRAVKKWGPDHQMIVYTINKQIKSLLVVVDYMNKELLKYESISDKEKIIILALNEWTDDGEFNVFSESVDWVMVEYTIKKQFKALNSY